MIVYIHFSTGSALDLLRQIALALDLEPAHCRGDLVRQIADAVVRLNQSKKQHPILICDEAHLLPHPEERDCIEMTLLTRIAGACMRSRAPEKVIFLASGRPSRIRSTHSQGLRWPKKNILFHNYSS